jgi:hypothetical protein
VVQVGRQELQEENPPLLLDVNDLKLKIEESVFARTFQSFSVRVLWTNRRLSRSFA